MSLTPLSCSKCLVNLVKSSSSIVTTSVHAENIMNYLPRHSNHFHITVKHVRGFSAQLVMPNKFKMQKLSFRHSSCWVLSKVKHNRCRDYAVKFFYVAIISKSKSPSTPILEKGKCVSISCFNSSCNPKQYTFSSWESRYLQGSKGFCFCNTCFQSVCIHSWGAFYAHLK